MSLEPRMVIAEFLRTQPYPPFSDKCQEVLQRMKNEACKVIDEEFLMQMYQHGMQRGRDIEFRTAQEHAHGMNQIKENMQNKLGGGTSE